MAITIAKDLRAKFGPIRDQDPRPTCMAFAASDAHAATMIAWRMLSVEWAYYHALKRDGSVPHAGSTMASMLKGIEIDGQPDESGWPYVATLFTNASTWVPPTIAPIYRQRSVRRSATIDSLVERIDAYEPVLFTMSVSPAFFQPNTEGLVAASEPMQPNRVHALVAVGYGRHAGELAVLVRNSWGTAWGIGGYGWISRTYLEARLLAAATMKGTI